MSGKIDGKFISAAKIYIKDTLYPINMSRGRCVSDSAVTDTGGLALALHQQVHNKTNMENHNQIWYLYIRYRGSLQFKVRRTEGVKYEEI